MSMRKQEDKPLGDLSGTLRGTSSEANKKLSFNLDEPNSAGLGKLLPLGSNSLSRKMTIGK